MMKRLLLLCGLGMGCIAIVLILFRGNPRDEVNLNSVADLAESVIRHLDKTTKVMVKVTDEEEMLIGNKMHEKIIMNRLATAMIDTPLDHYLNDVGQRVASNAKRKGIDYQFHLLDSVYKNAKAAPGGHIYITLGLLNALDTEAELAAVLGHEIAHVDAGHAIDSIKHKVSLEKIKEKDMDVYTDIGYSILIKVAYSEYEESEADRAGAFLSTKAGYHPKAIIYAFRNTFKVNTEARNKAKGMNPIGDTLMAMGGLTARYFKTHPETEERIKKIERYIEENELYDPSQAYYVGQRNKEELKSVSTTQYEDEWQSDYPLIEKEESPEDTEEEDAIITVEELYTKYGRIYIGMGIDELKEMIPDKHMAFERENRIGFKKMLIYRTELDGRKITRGLWIGIDQNKVKEIKVMN